MRAPVEIALGTDVRGFVLEARLGAGGFATVYRAHRGERRYALKFIRTQLAGHWAQREVEILQRLAHPNVVGFEGCGFWPDDTHEFSVIIMDYVEGRRLDAWAEEENPDARQVALKVLGVARALSALHQEKVVHRDVKEPNILVRASDGEAVLVDFGVAGGEQLRRVTRDMLPPTTPQYRAPEAWRFFRENVRGGQAHYEPGPGDDVYALGVVLYWLLTGRLPCEGATQVEQVEATLHQVPEPPRVLNPRVPEALSAVCMRMLEKWPEKRYPDGAGVYAALTEALAGADAEWAVPLCESHDADKVTTQAELAKAGDDDGVERALRQARHAYERPRRGRRLAVPPPVEPPGPPPAASELPASPPTPAQVEGGTAPGGRSRLSVAVRVAVGLVAVGAVGLGVAWLGPHLPRASSPPTAAELPGSTPRPTAAQPEPTWEIGWKVAPPWKPPEATGPDLFGTEEAARVAPSSLRERGEASVKTPQQKQKKGLGSVGKAACTGAALLTVACTGPQVRPMPPGEECPADALEAMAALGIPAEQHVFFRNNLPHVNGVQQDYVTVKEGWIEGSEKPGDFGFTTVSSLEREEFGLSGRLFFCGERVCGRFTEGRSRSRGTFPVCLELIDREDKKRGTQRRGPGATGDNVTIHVGASVKPVKRFE